ncbi:MAG: hypothetical protein ABI977_06020 [Acidobacteriota bacterium]
MNTVLFISLLLFAAAAIAFRFSNRRTAEPEISRRLPASQFDGLFAERHAEEARALSEENAKSRNEATRRQLLERAAEGEIKVLDEAHAFGNALFYREVLQAIHTQADGNPKVLQSIAKYIVDSQKLRSSRELAEAVIEMWSNCSGQHSLTEMLYLAALADDTAIFTRAVNAALLSWREDRIGKVSAKEFLATVESAYWLVASEVRTSGAGFLLKQAIADVRRELAAANRRLA